MGEVGDRGALAHELGIDSDRGLTAMASKNRLQSVLSRPGQHGASHHNRQWFGFPFESGADVLNDTLDGRSVDLTVRSTRCADTNQRDVRLIDCCHDRLCRAE